MEIYSMATTRRHNKITSTITGEIFSRYRDLVEKGFLLPSSEEVALVHHGSMKESFLQLVDINAIKDRNYFVEHTINDLEYVQPDFFMFKDNPYLENKRETRTAGFPDLIIEVWSEGNFAYERSQKLSLYSSSPITEHWYIDQDKNTVECHLGNTRLPDQNLKEILITRDNIMLDLRYLAL